MNNEDKRVTEYIEKAASFAKPILSHLRQLVHKVCPQVEETIKWGFPHFDYNGLLCSMASFKHHCAFTFNKASLLSDHHQIFHKVGNTSMGQLGRIMKISDLPDDGILMMYLEEAIELNKKGKIKKAAAPTLQKELTVPAYLTEALNTNPAAGRTFAGLSYSHKKEYVQWLEGAKTENTRAKRLQTTLEWLEEGKTRNWKYER